MRVNCVLRSLRGCHRQPMFWMPDLFFACFFRLVRTQLLKSRLEMYQLPTDSTDEARLAELANLLPLAQLSTGQSKGLTFQLVNHAEQAGAIHLAARPRLGYLNYLSRLDRDRHRLA